MNYPILPLVFKGSRDIDVLVSCDLSTAFQPVYVRCHFRNGSSTSNVSIDLDSMAGEEYDVRLFEALSRGPGADLHLVFTNEERLAWTFHGGNQLRIRWTNPQPDVIAWGLEVGLLPL